MGGLGAVACGAGLRDGLNPYMLMTCAVFIAYGFWLNKRSLCTGWSRAIFIAAYATGILVFNFSPVQAFLFDKNFILGERICYFLLGLWAFFFGVLFFKDWFLLLRKKTVLNNQSMEVAKLSAGRLDPAVCFITAVLALVLSALATLWPVNNYMMILGNEALIRGLWKTMIPLLLVYVLFSMWPLWFVWVFLSIKGLRPSMVKIVCSAVFFTASSVLIFIFK